MEAFLVSMLVVAVGEIGDKTQLLALVLSARYRRPLPIVLAILAATVANHALAGAVGEWVRSAMSPQTLQWVLGASFMAIGVWALRPDKLEEVQSNMRHYGVFAVTDAACNRRAGGEVSRIHRSRGGHHPWHADCQCSGDSDRA